MPHGASFPPRFRTGTQALGITALVGFLIGVVLSYLSAQQLQTFGADQFIVRLLGVAIVREFGPVLAAILVAGWSGSAITAQLGANPSNSASTDLKRKPVGDLLSVSATPDCGADPDAIITVEGLRTTFGDNIVHENLNLCVKRGEILSLVGGSGSGKTTLLREIIGLDEPSAGTIEISGKTLHTLTCRERRLLSRRWGVLFQAGALFSALRKRWFILPQPVPAARKDWDNSNTFIATPLIMQKSFSDLEYAAKKKLTRRNRFLAKIWASPEI
jgi:ABC-type transport system involved in cytochrome bd biosynthesis fused ATPase/permease subunit